jgi:hypothetical protein
MTIFDEALATAKDSFLETFGETVTYRPGVLSREITVIIKHLEDASQALPGIRHRSPLIQIKTANDSALGIAADEFEQGQTISCPPRKGSAARLFRLTRIIKQTTVWVWYEAK